MIQYAKVESIQETGECGMYTAILSVRETPMCNYHGYAITVIGKDLTECVTRTNTILTAFNKTA